MPSWRNSKLKKDAHLEKAEICCLDYCKHARYMPMERTETPRNTKTRFSGKPHGPFP